jgi:hypothetical protein
MVVGEILVLKSLSVLGNCLGGGRQAGQSLGGEGIGEAGRNSEEEQEAEW